MHGFSFGPAVISRAQFLAVKLKVPFQDKQLFDFPMLVAGIDGPWFELHQ